MEKLLITGQMRSGTTFIANFLNSQRHMTVYSDFLISMFLHGARLQINKINSKLTDRQKNILISNLKAEANAFNIEGYNDLNKEEFDTWNELMELCLNKIIAYEGETETKVIGIKKTVELYYISQLLENDYKIIYMYRDPRDVFLSAKNRFSDYSLYGSINDWIKDMDYIMKYLNNKNLLLVKYEELMLSKEDVSAKIAEFIGAEIKTDIESLTNRKKNVYNDNSSFHDVTKLFDQTALFRWKKDLNSEEVVLCSVVLKDYLNKLGYEPHSPEKESAKQIVGVYKKHQFKKKLVSKLKRSIKSVLKM